MAFIEERSFLCPYCGQPNTLALEHESQTFELITDCETCCRPVVIRVKKDRFDTVIDAQAENA